MLFDQAICILKSAGASNPSQSLHKGTQIFEESEFDDFLYQWDVTLDEVKAGEVEDVEFVKYRNDEFIIAWAL